MLLNHEIILRQTSRNCQAVNRQLFGSFRQTSYCHESSYEIGHLLRSLRAETFSSLVLISKRGKKILNFRGGYQELSKIVRKSIKETKMYFEKIENNLRHM